MQSKLETVVSEIVWSEIRREFQEARYLIYLIFVFRDVPGCSRMFHVPVLSTAILLALTHWIVIYPVDRVTHPLNNWAMKFTKLFTLITTFHMNKVSCLACFVIKIKLIEKSAEGQRSFRGFRSRNGSKLPNFSPQRATKEYKYGT